MSRGGRRSSRGAGPADADLPLEALEAALAPVRRALIHADRVGTPGDHLAPIVQRHLATALELQLPEALRAPIERMHARATALDPDAAADIAAELHRVDAVAGLPLARPLRPVRKAPLVYPDPPLVSDAPPPAAEGPASPEASDTPSEPEVERLRWDGATDVPVVEVLPDMAGRLPDDLSVGQLLFSPPRASRVIAPVHGAGRPLPDGQAAVGGRVRLRSTLLTADGRRETRLRLVGAGPLDLVWRDEPPPHPSLLPTGERVVVVGRAEGGVLYDAEVVSGEAGRSVTLPSYEEDGRAWREAVLRLRPHLAQLRDPLGPRALRPLGLPSRAQVVEALQAGELRGARRRLAYDEALYLALGVGVERYSAANDRGVPHPVAHGFAALAAGQLELGLSDPAQAVLEEIKRTLRTGSPTRRVLTGEVGAGKGRIALLAAAMVAEGKGQVLVLAPDDAAVDETFAHSEPLLREGGLVARRVRGTPPKAMADAIRRGEVHLIFGTHDLIAAGLEFRRLGLVVSIERFPFGTVTEGYAALQAPRPDLLVLTQIPVGPRVLSTAYPDFDVSIVVDPGRHPARIEVLRADARDTAYTRLREAVGRGEQGMLLFPRVKGADALDLRQAHAVVQALQADALEGQRVALLHGAMRPDERQRVFDDLQHRRIDVLVATTPVEDGPPVPGLTTTVIEQADRMEQWRLHRVIGFLSTTPRDSQALLIVGEHADADADARIQRVLDARNGFALTEARVALRGVEACVASPRWGLPDTDWLDLDTDLDLLLGAREEAHRILRADPSLRRGSHADLANEVRSAWDDLWPDDATPPCPIQEGPPPERRRRRRRRRRR